MGGGGRPSVALLSLYQVAWRVFYFLVTEHGDNEAPGSYLMVACFFVVFSRVFFFDFFKSRTWSAKKFGPEISIDWIRCCLPAIDVAG